MGDGGDGNGATYLRRRRQGDPGGFAEEDRETNGGFLGTERSFCSGPRSRDENCDFSERGLDKRQKKRQLFRTRK